MKRKTLLSLLAGIVLLVTVYFGFRDTLDRFNPLIDKEYVYVEIQEEPVDDDGRFKYRVDGVTENGEEKRVNFTTSIVLEEGTYLKVLAKGAHTEEIIFITADEMP